MGAICSHKFGDCRLPGELRFGLCEQRFVVQNAHRGSLAHFSTEERAASFLRTRTREPACQPPGTGNAVPSCSHAPRRVRGCSGLWSWGAGAPALGCVSAGLTGHRMRQRVAPLRCALAPARPPGPGGGRAVHSRITCCSCEHTASESSGWGSGLHRGGISA